MSLHSTLFSNSNLSHILLFLFICFSRALDEEHDEYEQGCTGNIRSLHGLPLTVYCALLLFSSSFIVCYLLSGLLFSLVLVSLFVLCFYLDYILFSLHVVISCLLFSLALSSYNCF